MKQIIKKVIKKISLTLMVLTVTFSAWATSLDQAKSDGLVGEMSNGYLGIVISSPEISNLVSTVNDKRKTIYMKLARKNKLTMAQITDLAGKKAIAKTQSGHFIKNSSGSWVKK